VQELINEISDIHSFKGLFKVYINNGLAENPDGLFRELYEQISLNYHDSIDLMGEKLVKLVMKYVEESDVFTASARKFIKIR
jgi:hypothetical protein